MRTILAIAILLVLAVLATASWASEETYGLGEPASESQPVAYYAETYGLGTSVYVATMQDCPGGICPLPTRTVTRSVARYTPAASVLCPNCPSPTVVTRAMPVASSDCPNCPTSVVSTTSAIVPPGYHSHRAHDGSIVVHHNSNFGNMAAHRGMSLTRLAEAGEPVDGSGRVVRGWQRPIMRAVRNRPVLFPRIRAAFRR